jgi:hypothetical protein
VPWLTPRRASREGCHSGKLLALITVLSIVLGFPALHFYICIEQQRRYLRQVTEGFPGSYNSPVPFTDQIRSLKGSYRFNGRSLQRTMILQYFYGWTGLFDLIPRIAPEERLEIRFPVVQKFWLRMILDPNHSYDPDAVQTNDPEMNRLYIIHSNHPEAAKNFLATQGTFPDLRLNHPLDRLEIHQGWGMAEFFFPAHRNFGRTHLELLSSWLSRFLSDYESQSKIVLAITISGDARCPYCREPLESSAEKVIQCIRCGAKLHENCWKENKQCTTWGCESSVASPI